MTTPAPQRASVDFWNRMMVLDRDDGADLDRINWRLSKEAERSPHDFVTRLAAARGLLRRGRKADAMTHLDVAWNSKSGRSAVELINLAVVLCDGGRLEDSLTLLKALLGRPEAHNDQRLHDAAVGLGLRLGDATLIEHAGESTGIRDELVPRFCARLRDDGLISAFTSHQRAVESVAGAATCGTNGALLLDEDGDVGVLLTYFTALEAQDRYELYGHLSHALAQHGAEAASSVVSVFFSGPEIACPEEPL
ncbi:hypothetical protein HL658_29770 [Azospirillum sp. RWY-5-1]|uniref:Tetratricopeptide repeat protein n=1 Tax=Azospirillum oleiclasticum TaxID=2735135 RepID=A0ABX2TJT9_9PROT|nr:hypothetical protein [Azospirillum oleiclasticum]NYZ16755.1 hypothetical protein [Azospirillum oleiclasticum]NYZ23344.1 hypothetical protein [Azospirillum oleiclasticum]